MREPHIIYGYRCKVGKRAGQWKIGCKGQRQDKHRKGNSACPLFDRYWKAREREGYSFDDVFEYFQLRVFVCSRRDAEQWEDIYTQRYNAVEPNGFCINSGNYNGSSSDIHRKRLSKAHKGIKNTEETRRKISEKNTKTKLTKLARRKKRKIVVSFSCRELAELIVLESGRLVTAQEVKKALDSVRGFVTKNMSTAVGALARACADASPLICRYESNTRTDYYGASDNLISQAPELEGTLCTHPSR